MPAACAALYMLRITLLSGQELTSIAVEDALDVKALKQRLNKSHGLPPRFRQRLLQEGQTLDDAFQLDSPMDLQVVLTTFAKPSHCQVEQLIIAARDGFVSEVGLHIDAKNTVKTVKHYLQLDKFLKRDRAQN